MKVITPFMVRMAKVGIFSSIFIALTQGAVQAFIIDTFEAGLSTASDPEDSEQVVNVTTLGQPIDTSINGLPTGDFTGTRTLSAAIAGFGTASLSINPSLNRGVLDLNSNNNSGFNMSVIWNPNQPVDLTDNGLSHSFDLLFAGFNASLTSSLIRITGLNGVSEASFSTPSFPNAPPLSVIVPFSDLNLTSGTAIDLEQVTEIELLFSQTATPQARNLIIAEFGTFGDPVPPAVPEPSTSKGLVMLGSWGLGLMMIKCLKLRPIK